ncbi:MAG TPA: TraB/GumN family protein, partial [Phenylobacterium sp.]
ASAAPATARLRAFETAEQQIRMFDEAPLAEQVAALRSSLEELESDPDAYAHLLAAWTAQDLDWLARKALDPVRTASPELYRRLVTERNARWTATLRDRLEGSGRTVVVVGVGHLVGADGLPARLRALGYAVEGP